MPKTPKRDKFFSFVKGCGFYKKKVKNHRNPATRKLARLILTLFFIAEHDWKIVNLYLKSIRRGIDKVYASISGLSQLQIGHVHSLNEVLMQRLLYSRLVRETFMTYA